MTRHAFGCCVAKYDTMQAALLCCDPDFNTTPRYPRAASDYRDAPPAGMPPERYAYEQRSVDPEEFTDDAELQGDEPVDIRPDGGGCPQCGGQTRREGGCPTCTDCGWSKCGGAF